MGITKQEIIDKCIQLFNEKSYSATSVQDIADALGVTKAALYYYISSKEEILYEIFNQTMSTAERRLEKILEMEKEMPAEEQVKKLIYNHIMAVFDEAPNISIFFTERAHLSLDNLKTINIRRRKYEKQIEEVFRKGVKQGVFNKNIDILPTVYALLGMCNWLYHWYDPNGRLRPTELAELYANLLLHGILNPNNDYKTNGSLLTTLNKNEQKNEP